MLTLNNNKKLQQDYLHLTYRKWQKQTINCNRLWL